MKEKKEEMPKYYEQMNYEAILGKAIDRIAQNVAKNNKPAVKCSILALTHLMPHRTKKDVREYMNKLGLGVLSDYTSTDHESYKKLFDLWDYCSEILDKCGLLFKVGRGVEQYGIA